MALSALSGIWGTWDRGTSLGDTAQRDVSGLLMSALNTSPGSLMQMITKGEAITNRKHEWVEQSLNPNVVTSLAVTGGISGSATNTVLSVSAADFATLTIGDTLVNKTRFAGGEVMQITALTAANNIALVRGLGSTSGSTAHADNDVLEVIPARQEGSTIGIDRTRQRKTRYNYTHIFDTAVRLSRSALNTAMYGVSDEFENSCFQRTIELKNQINKAMLKGAAAATPSDSVYGSTQGIIHMINTGGDIGTPGSAGTNVDSSTTALTYAALSDLMGTVAISNGNRDGRFVVVTGQSEYEVMSEWPFSQVQRQYSPSGQTYGSTLDKVVSRQAITASVILEPDMPPGVLLLLDLNRISIRPLANSAYTMYVDELGAQGNDFKQARFVSELTLEMHNADVAHGMMTALAD